MKDISIIIPAYNEEKSIEILVNKIIKSTKKINITLKSL